MYTQPYRNPPQHDRLVQETAKALNGEYSAILCYEQLAKLAHHEEERRRIMEIRSDEIRHYRVFSAIYTSLTGRVYTPHISEPCPADYSEGVTAALKDEQETVDFYLKIADETPEVHIREQFRRAAADEQNHAVWFLYFLTKTLMGR